MRMRARIFAIATAFLLAACGSSTTTPPSGTAKVTPPPNSALFTAGTLTIGSDVSYPPQEFFPEGSTTPDGFDIDLGKAMAKEMGLGFAVVNTPFDGIIPALNSKKFDIMISTLNLTKLEDLCGHKVAAESGTAELDEANGLNKAGAACANNKVKVTSFQKDTEALVELKKGNVEVHFTDSPVAAYEVLKDSSNLKLSGGIIEVAPEGIALRKNDAALADPIKAAFEMMKSDGSYAAVLAKWNVSDGDITKAS